MWDPLCIFTLIPRVTLGSHAAGPAVDDRASVKINLIDSEGHHGVSILNPGGPGRGLGGEAPQRTAELAELQGSRATRFGQGIRFLGLLFSQADAVISHLVAHCF